MNTIYAEICYTKYNSDLDITDVYYKPINEELSEFKDYYELTIKDVNILRIKHYIANSSPSYQTIYNFIFHNLSMDSLTREKIDKFYEQVLPKEKIKDLVFNVAKVFDENILRVLGPIDKKDVPHYGKYFDFYFANEFNKLQNNFFFRPCENDNTETDIVCFETSSFDIEVKTAVGSNNFKNHICQNVEKSRKTKSMDEMHYYILCRLERNFETYRTTVKEIYFGRISELHWKKEANSQSSYLRKATIISYFDKIF